MSRVLGKLEIKTIVTSQLDRTLVLEMSEHQQQLAIEIFIAKETRTKNIFYISKSEYIN